MTNKQTTVVANGISRDKAPLLMDYTIIECVSHDLELVKKIKQKLNEINNITINERSDHPEPDVDAKEEKKQPCASETLPKKSGLESLESFSADDSLAVLYKPPSLFF